MAALSVQSIGASGLAPTLATAGATGDAMPLAARNDRHGGNGSAAAITATLKTKKPRNYNESNDKVFSVAAGGELLIRPGAIPGGIERLANANGRAEFTDSATPSVTVATIGA